MCAKNISSGFTLVELLIVIVVIGILATVSIVAYNSIQEKARTSSVSAALSQAKTKLETYKIENGSYPVSLNDVSINGTDSLSYQYAVNNTTSPATFCITATSGNISHKITQDSQPSSGGCPGHGQGGVAAITNMAPNPSAENSTGWYSNNSSIFPKTQDNTRSRTGNYSTSAHNVGVATSLVSLYAVGALNGNGFNIEENTTYNISLYFTADVPHRGYLGCSFRVGSTYTSAYYSPNYTGSPGSWTRAAHTCTSPAGATMLRLSAGVSSSTNQPAGTKGYVDDLMVVASDTTPAYADGASPNWVWNGTPNASTSTGPSL